MQIRCGWRVELGELSSMTRGDIEKVKAFITRKVDRFRPSYGRRVIEVPRQAILIGSTNLDIYLKDETGGRRYWPILCEGKRNWPISGVIIISFGLKRCRNSKLEHHGGYPMILSPPPKRSRPSVTSVTLGMN